MLKIELAKSELFDESSSAFIQVDGKTLCLEHSLVSLSKWESIHQIPFLDGKQRTKDEIHSYIKCMSVNGEIDDLDLATLSREQFGQIVSYIESTNSATTFSNMVRQQGTREIITSELIYYWMVTYRIPFQPTETWHLNRLFALVRICNVKSSKPKKVPKSELAAQMRELNAKRRRELGTTG